MQVEILTKTSNINDAQDQIKSLEQEYERIYGKSVDYSILPNGITKEKMVKVLERMIDKNESLTVAYGKLFKARG